MGGRGTNNPRDSGCFDMLTKCFSKEEPDDEEKYFRYKGTKDANTAGIYMCPRNVDNLPEAIEMPLEELDYSERMELGSRDQLHPLPNQNTLALTHLQRGKPRRKLARSRAAILNEMRKKKGDSNAAVGGAIAESQI